MSLSKTRIAVFVSGGGTNLQALIDAAKRGEIPSGEIALVLASNDKAYALTRAAENNIPSIVVKRKEFETQLAYEEAVKAILAENSIDMIVLAGFMSILSENFTAAYPKRIVNVHPSLIPSFCGKGFYGLHVHEAALAYGVKVTGATVHYVNEIPDGGEIICRRQWKSKKGIPLRYCKEESWSRRNGFFCRRQWKWWQQDCRKDSKKHECI